MKLKTKLAEDSLIAHGYWNEGMDGEVLDMLTEISLAGFEKCRELAQKCFEDSRAKYSGLPFSEAFERVLFDLKTLGEEEAEGQK